MHTSTASMSRASYARAPLSRHPTHLVRCNSHAPHHAPRNEILHQLKATKLLQTGVAAAAALLIAVSGADARLEGVNKPELLPKEYTPVIDVAGFLTAGEVCKIMCT